MSDTDRMINVANQLRDAIKAQAHAMSRRSKGITFATYVLAGATVVLAVTQFVQVLR